MVRQLMFGMLAVFMLLGGVVTLVNVRAQAPEKAQIAFNSRRDRDCEIYVMDADGNNQRNLTNNPAIDAGADWFDPAFTSVSPAGKLKGTWGWVKQNSK